MCELLLPLLQSPEYARAVRLMGINVRCIRQRCDGSETLWWQVQSRNFAVLGQVDMVSRGPVAPQGRPTNSWLYNFRRWQDGRPLVLNAAGIPPDDLRGAGFWPLMTPTSVALLPLCDPDHMRATLHQKWRNRLNKALTTGLHVSQVPLGQRHWILKAEEKQAAQRGYRTLPRVFAQAYAKANPGAALVWEVRRNTEPLAAVLVLRHGPMCTWHIGHVTPQGRQVNAMNLALWTAMCWLSEAGHKCLDLGILNTDDAAGVARFKLGTGAGIQKLGGTWLHLGSLAPLARRLPTVLAA